ncbi:hypothetical protein DPMN_004033 [Dreissena polymorpha]|uniref:Uncharacterized protein n=1 Tax=Dreissena polymorpha TaxID=45954 RepID=A0A9D4MQ20_DREPO|nr:hypothetical protein DPMN_004033 [Dreissena polymorpha]
MEATATRRLWSDNCRRKYFSFFEKALDDLISNEIMHKTHLAKAMTGEIREGLLIAEHYAMVVVISKKFALPISTVEENMRWASRSLRVMYCGENI